MWGSVRQASGSVRHYVVLYVERALTTFSKYLLVSEKLIVTIRFEKLIMSLLGYNIAS